MIIAIPLVFGEGCHILKFPDNVCEKSLIVNTVLKEFDITWELLSSRSRKSEFVTPRQIAMTLMSKYSKIGYADIGLFFGGYDHATIVHSKKTVSNRSETNKEYKKRYDKLCLTIERKMYERQATERERLKEAQEKGLEYKGR